MVLVGLILVCLVMVGVVLVFGIGWFGIGRFTLVWFGIGLFGSLEAFGTWLSVINVGWNGRAIGRFLVHYMRVL